MWTFNKWDTNQESVIGNNNDWEGYAYYPFHSSDWGRFNPVVVGEVDENGVVRVRSGGQRGLRESSLVAKSSADVPLSGAIIGNGSAENGCLIFQDWIHRKTRMKTFEGRDEPENPTNGAEEVGCGSEGFIGEINNRLDIHHMDKECLKNEWTVCIPLVKPPVTCQVADPKAVNNNCVHSNNVNKEFGATSLFQIEVVEHTADKVRYTLLTGRVYAVY